MADLTKTTLFKEKVPARDKAEHTTFVARTIMDAETAAREKKTERLRALRLEQEARLAAEAAEKPKAPAKVVRAPVAKVTPVKAAKAAPAKAKPAKVKARA